MTANVFVDTNVLIYAVDVANLQKHKAARAWRSWLWDTNRGRLSFQVLQEFYVNALRKQLTAHAQIRQEIADLTEWRPLVVDEAIVYRAWKIEDRYGLSFWDSLILAAARVADCKYLLTEDLQHEQQLDGLVVLNPFLTNPSSLD